MISIGIVGIDFGEFLTSLQPSSVGEMLIDTLQIVDPVVTTRMIIDNVSK